MPGAAGVILLEATRQAYARIRPGGGGRHGAGTDTGDAAAARAAVDDRISRIERSDTACLIYTSGTGGAPRGVMQHHGAILHNAAGAAEVLVNDFGIGDAQSTSGTLAPMTYFFSPRNINPAECFATMRSANHQANAFSVASGVLDVATSNTVNTVFLRKQNPQIASQIQEIWQSPPIPESGILVRDDVTRHQQTAA